MPFVCSHRLRISAREALAAARGLQRDETALADVLRDLEQERNRAAEAYHAVLARSRRRSRPATATPASTPPTSTPLSVAVARRLGLEAQAVAEVEAVALLHDVGKIGIPDAILRKAGPLRDDEWKLMREHPVIGERILRPLPGLSAVATAVRHEHERWDGGGYPDGWR
jgi:HD-GYP domain-containing protein (c-di-GMP phosphodiesterase class II)